MSEDSNQIPRRSLDPEEILALVARGCDRTAAATLSVFTMLGFAQPQTSATDLKVPASFLAGLGFAIRAFCWEANGFQVHQDEGLPPAVDLLTELMRRTAGPTAELNRYVASMVPRFVAVAHRFAAQGQSLLGAEVALGEPDDETLVEALARLCWAFREGGANDEKAR